MPGTLKVKIVAGRHLPIMDRASDLTDAFVEVKFGNTTFKTGVFPKSLNPEWNSEWFKFEVDDEALQDEPLQITVLDHDTYSANDAIGKVYIDIDPLLSSDAAAAISGWLPIYDTIHGIRGEINIVVKVDLFNDSNRFRKSSCGVKFFCTPSVPSCYRLAALHGFVEELVMNEDPEYRWIDRIRTLRASNEARQRLVSLMSGELQRKIGLKVLAMGGNAVLGYLQCFDLEGESGLVVRAIGTACTLDKPGSRSPSCPPAGPKGFPDSQMPSTGRRSTLASPVPSMATPPLSQGFSLSVPALAYSGAGSNGSGGKETLSFKMAQKEPTKATVEKREFPFFTLTRFPPGWLLHVGGVVTARSVKLLDRVYNPDEPETRDAWWEEIRQEIKSHAKALGCHTVVGYSESTSICEEVCILSAVGTAAILNPALMQEGGLDACGEDGSSRVDEQSCSSSSCVFCHVPYGELKTPFPARLAPCCSCGRHKVPDVLFTTVEVPAEAAVSGKGCLIQARLCRVRKKVQGEANATAVSNLLPFVEYELHSQLLKKLKLRAMNALFGLRVHVSLGVTVLVGLASATGVCLAALPSPGGMVILGKTPGDTAHKQHVPNTRRKMRNEELYEISTPEVAGAPVPEPQHRSRLLGSSSESWHEGPELDLAHAKKDAFVLEIDDGGTLEDVCSLLADAPLPPGFYSCNTEVMPGIYNWTSAVQMFTSVRVFRLSGGNLTNRGVSKTFNDLCEDLLKSLYFKLRSMVPCCLCHLNFCVAAPEDELVQVTVTAVAMTFKDGAREPIPKDERFRACPVADRQTDEPEPSTAPDSPTAFTSRRGLPGGVEPHDAPRASCVDYGSFTDRRGSLMELIKVKAQTLRGGSIKTTSPPEGAGPLLRAPSPSAPSCSGNGPAAVKMTPLSFLPGTTRGRHLGVINMFFVRETSSLREEGGASGFLHSFVAEVFAVVRAHVAALGGDAVLSFRVKECVLRENPNKNQAQCVIGVGGDAVASAGQVEPECQRR